MIQKNNDSETESSDWSDCDEEDWDECIDRNKFDDLSFINLDEKITITKISSIENSIIIKTSVYKEFFEQYKNINIREIKITISVDKYLNINNITIKKNNIDYEKNDSYILCKLEKILNKSNIIISDNLIFDLNNILYVFFHKQLFNDCFICDKPGIIKYKHDYKIITFNFCGDMLCLSNSFLSDKSVLLYNLENDYKKFTFMLYLFIYSCFINRMPCILPENTDLNEILTLFSEIKSIENMKNEILTYSSDLISLLNWLIITYTDKISSPYFENKFTCFDIYEDLSKKNIHLLDYSDNNFQKMNTGKKIGKYHVYHGSRDCNYFNIIMSGLKNLSKTQYEVNGTVHGNGIYFGSEYTANGYNIKKLTNMNYKKDTLNKHIFQLLEKCEYYNAPKILGCDIYYEETSWANNNYCIVIPKDENVLIKKIKIQI